MNADNATPRPWSVNDWPQRDADIRIGAAGTPLIATVHLRDTSINGQRANTALIIRAVNSYDAMRDALDRALNFCQRMETADGEMPPMENGQPALTTIKHIAEWHAKNIRAALALAD